MKNHLITTLGSLLLLSPAQASFPDFHGSILLGGGYLEDPGEGFVFGQLRGTLYESDSLAHDLFLEILVHNDDAVVVIPDRFGGFFVEDGDITFVNLTLNYELEAQLGGPLSFFVGGGAGVEFVSLDDRFNFSIDTDSNFVGQVFAGLRANFQNGFWAQVGARYVFRDDFSLLGDQFETEDSVGYEAAFGFRF